MTRILTHEVLELRDPAKSVFNVTAAAMATDSKQKFPSMFSDTAAIARYAVRVLGAGGGPFT